VTTGQKKKLDTDEGEMLCYEISVSRKDKIRNEGVRETLGIEKNRSEKIKESGLRWSCIQERGELRWERVMAMSMGKRKRESCKEGGRIAAKKILRALGLRPQTQPI